jgi:uncharacterized protein YidB (DUF937 family)
MGIFDAVKNLAGGMSGGENHAAVATGLLQEIGGPAGIAGLVQTLHQNGAGGLVQQWAAGQTQPANASAIQQGIGGSAMIDSIAQRTGLSSDSVRAGLAIVVPLMVSHVMSNGHITADGQPAGNPAPEAGSLIQSVLAKIL